MVPIDRFNLDHHRIQFLTDDEYDVQGCTSAVGGRKPGTATEEVFFIEETRKVSKTNVFSINSQKYECPVDLRNKKIQVRYDRSKRSRFIVYFADKRMGEASLLDLHYNANQRKNKGDNT